jgi:hypothetical protein
MLVKELVKINLYCRMKEIDESKGERKLVSGFDSSRRIGKLGRDGR